MTIIKEPETDYASREEYLMHVVIKYLRANAGKLDTVFYDSAECDAYCLAEDLENQFLN